MRIGLFEQQMARIIPSFAGFTEFTSSIPKLYWDVKSQEQRILAICKLLNKVICYADMLGENVDEIAHTMQEILDGKLDPIIIAAIAEWFENNQPAIAADIAALQAALPIADYNASHTVSDAIAAGDAAINAVIGNGFDADNTVANAINNIADEIGNGFDSSHTIADAISANADAISANASDIAKIKLKNMSFPAWEIKDRYIIDETANTAGTTGAQAGCYFNQDGVYYDATMINKNNSSACDTIRIRDAETFLTVVDFPIDTPCHGLALEYNPATKELMYYNENMDSVIIIDVSTIATPVVTLQIPTTGIDVQYGFCWYSANEIIVYRMVDGQQVCDIRKRDINFTYVRSVTLDNPDNVNTTIYQDCCYSNGLFALAVSFPEAVIVYDFENGEVLNVINIPPGIGHTICTELEGISIDETRIYIEYPANVDNVNVVTWAYWNFIQGNLKADETIHIWGSQDAVGTCIVNWNTGSLIDPIGNNARTFKLAGDAENFAKMNYPNQEIIIVFDSDYPLYFYMMACAAGITLGANKFPLGMRLSYMPALSISASNGCEVGGEITIDHSVAQVTGAANVAASGSNGIWNFNASIINSNQAFNKLSAQYSRVLSPSKPTNSTAWKCYFNTPVDNWN